MAWIEKRGDKRIVRWREEDGTVHSRGGLSPSEARLMKATIEKQQLEGSYTSKELRAQLFVDFIETTVLGDLGLRGSTRSIYEVAVRKHLRPRLGSIQVGEVNPTAMRKLFADLYDQEGAWTANLAYRVVRKAVRAAVDEGLLVRNPLANVRVPKPQRREVRILTSPEVQALAEAIEPRFRAMIYLSAYGGLRIGELGALRREDLDLENAVVNVRQAVSTPSGKKEIGPPKTKASRRSITIPSWLVAELAEHLLAHGGGEYVFQHADGRIVTHNNIAPAWKKAQAGAGVKARFHDLRHTAVALLVQQGAHPKMIQSRMGHSSFNMTMDVYGHLFPSADAELAASLEVFKPKEAEVIQL